MRVQTVFIFALFCAGIFVISGCGGGGSTATTTSAAATSSTTWAAGLSVSKTGGTTIGSTAYYSSSRLAASWTAITETIDHYELTATESVQTTSVSTTAASSSTSATLTGLKSGTIYTVSLKACKDSSCSSSLSADASASGTTEQEYWQLQGSSSSDSFSAMTEIVTDGNTKAYAFLYGTGAPSGLEGKVRLYYDAQVFTRKGISLALTSSAVTTTPSSASAFTALGASAGVFRPSTDTSLINSTNGMLTSQSIPLPSSMGSKIRLFFEAEGSDAKTRIMFLDSQDGYTGEDFNSTSATSCSSGTDYTSDGCVPTVVIGVQGDATAGNTGLAQVRQFKIGYPVLSSWIWDGSSGTFMVITGEDSCGKTANGLAYAVWDGSNWNVEKDSSGCAKLLATNGHGPVVVHMGGVKYKTYYEDETSGRNDKPLKMIYGDGSASGSASTVEFADWESSSQSRDVNFLWPSGNAVSAANESGLGDHVIYMPAADAGTQFMYMNLGGFDDSSRSSAPEGLGMAVLINP